MNPVQCTLLQPIGYATIARLRSGECCTEDLQELTGFKKYRRPALLLALLLVILFRNAGNETKGQGQTRLVLAFYYAWYNTGSFGPGKTPFQPVQPYNSSDPATIQRHVSEARAAGIDGFVQSWYGPNEGYTNGNFTTLLNTAAANGFTAAVDFEPAAFYSSHEERAAGIRSLLETHANHPAYLRVDGKPVIFFWANWLYSVDDWAYIRSLADPNNTSIWIAEGGNTQFLAVFDGLHLYNTAWSAGPAGTAATWAANTRAAAATYGTFKYWVATALPGYDDRLLGRGDNSVYRDRAAGAYYQSSFAGAAASNPDLLIITSFNEWAEGSNIEPSLEFGSTYLDLTAQMAATYKAGGIPSAPPALPAPAATAAPASPPPPGAPEPSPLPLPSPIPTVSPTPVSSPTPNAGGEMIYTAVEGDSIYGIAARFGLTADEIYRLNNFTEETVIKIGDPVLIGYGTITLPAESAALAVSAPPTNVRADGAVIHIVVPGDTPIGIAVQYGLTLEEFYTLNGLTENSIFQPGDALIVGHQFTPRSSGGSTDFPAPTAPPTLEPLPPTATMNALPTSPPAQAAAQVASGIGPSGSARPTKDIAKAVSVIEVTATPAPSNQDIGDIGDNAGAGRPNLLLPLSAGLLMLVVGIMGFVLYRRQ